MPHNLNGIICKKTLLFGKNSEKETRTSKLTQDQIFFVGLLLSKYEEEDDASDQVDDIDDGDIEGEEEDIDISSDFHYHGDNDIEEDEENIDISSDVHDDGDENFKHE